MTAKDGKTELQRKFEEQTPTIHGIKGREYLFTFIAWLEFQVNKKEKQLSEAETKLIENDLEIRGITRVCNQVGGERDEAREQLSEAIKLLTKWCDHPPTKELHNETCDFVCKYEEEKK